MKQLFIRTKDEETKDYLMSNNFTFLNKEGTYYIFINDGNIKFSDNEMKNIFYSDKINY